MNQDLPSTKNSFPLTTVLFVVLALATLIFAGLFVYSFTQAQNATATLNQARNKAAIDAAAAQKKIDQKSFIAESESPYRSYKAPIEYGSFTVNFPKTWSSRVAESANGIIQVNLSVNPDFVRYKDDIAQPVALRVRLIQQNSNAYIATFAEAIKKGSLKKSSMTVSGQNAVVLTGHYHDDSGFADFVRLVAVPVRDKVVVFSSEITAYSAEIDTVLAQSKIIP